MEREKTPLHESFQDAPNILFCGQQYFIYHNKIYKTRSLSSHPMVRNFLYIVKSWVFFFSPFKYKINSVQLPKNGWNKDILPAFTNIYILCLYRSL